MSAERGWIGEPQPPREWHESIYSRQHRYLVKEKERQDRERAEQAARDLPEQRRRREREAREHAARWQHLKTP